EPVPTLEETVPEAIPLFVAAVPEDDEAGDEGPDVGHGHVQAGPPEAPGQEAQLDDSTPTATPLFGIRQREPAEVRHPVPQLGREHLGFVPFLGLLWRTVLDDEGLGRFLEQLLLVREAEAHDILL